MLVYLVVMLVGMSLYGVEPWVAQRGRVRRLFGLFGSLAPSAARRPPCARPFSAAARLAPVAGTAALLIVAIGSTAFDGAKEGALFNDIAQDLQDFFRDLGLSHRARARARVRDRPGRRGADRRRHLHARHARDAAAGRATSRRELARAFAHTLIPIAAGYLVAHYFSLLAYNGQDLWRLRQRPARRRLGPVRRRRARHRLRRRERHRHLVRAGRRARRRPRRRRWCSPTTARSSSTAPPARPPARRLSC